VQALAGADQSASFIKDQAGSNPRQTIHHRLCAPVRREAADLTVVIAVDDGGSFGLWMLLEAII
jgi:hypothetical protein